MPSASGSLLAQVLINGCACPNSKRLQGFLERESDTMKIFNRTIVCKQATASSILRGCVGLVLLLAFASTAVLGQSFTSIHPPTTTTPYAAPVTAPTSGLILPGTNLNPATGQPVRYLWYGDA